jgi:hypothetical protein
VKLNGTTAYVDLGRPTVLRLTGSMTVAAWINSSSFPSDAAAIVSSRDSASSGFQLDTNQDKGSRTISISLANSQGSRAVRYAKTTLQANTWYHVAGVYDASAGTLNVYINGQLDNGTLDGTVTGSQQRSNQPVNIGRRPGASGFQFAGVIDNVRIYGGALSQTEIQADMNGAVALNDGPSPVMIAGNPSTFH